MLSRFSFGLPALAALFVAVTCHAAPTACPANFLGGQAPDLVNAKLATKAHALCYSEFAVLHSGLTRSPLYSAEHLTAARISLAKQQHRNDAADTFHEEEQLPPDERASLKDFVRSGLDRGHMSPNGDMDNPKAQGESFTLANMIAQDPDDNRNLWEGIEEADRYLVEQYGEDFVVTIPVFAGAQTTWLNNRVAIPVKIAKAIFIPRLNAAAAYIVNNAPGAAWQEISIAQLRSLSGIDPFPALPESVKQATFPLPAPMIHGHRGS